MELGAWIAHFRRAARAAGMEPATPAWSRGRRIIVNRAGMRAPRKSARHGTEGEPPPLRTGPRRGAGAGDGRMPG